MMYWLCVVCGAILLVSFIPYSREHGLETWTVFVSLFAPAFPGLLYVLAKDAGESGSSILLLVVFTVYMLAVIGIVIDLVKRAFHKLEPMPTNGVVIGARFWSITSLGFLILAAGFFLYVFFKGEFKNNDEYIVIKKK